MLGNDIKDQILASLTDHIKPYKVILFGSYSYGTAEVDSDVDLIVVLDDDHMPRNYEENMQNYLKVASVLRDLRKNIPIDLIVHTKPMHDKFIDLGSMFSREVADKGKILYEKNS